MPGKRPIEVKADRLAREAVELVKHLRKEGAITDEDYLMARASALGLMVISAKLSGKPDPRLMIIKEKLTSERIEDHAVRAAPRPTGGTRGSSPEPEDPNKHSYIVWNSAGV